MDRSFIQSIDTQNMWQFLETFPDRWKEVMNLTEEVELTVDSGQIRNLCFVGMGSSAIGADLMQAYSYHRCPYPLQVIRHYEVPGWVNKHTLVIACSFSGNTEETLAALGAARSRGAQAIAITSGGNLMLRAANDEFDYITIPGGMPTRAALPYIFVPLYRIFTQLGFVEENEQALQETHRLLEDQNIFYSNPEDNEALTLAEELDDSLPVVYSDGITLEPVNRRWRCQLSENAKTLAYGNTIPELTHNEIVGWERLTHLTGRLSVILLVDEEDNERVKRRMEIVEELIRDQTATMRTLHTRGKTRMARMFSLVQLADWTSFYLAMINRIDPTPTTKIDLLKSKLAEA